MTENIKQKVVMLWEHENDLSPPIWCEE